MLTWYGRLKRTKNIISKEHPAACCEASEFKSHFVLVGKREGRDEAAFSVPFWMCVCSGAQLCPTLCDPVDCSPPGFSVHGILQARILEWVAIFSSRGSSWPWDWTRASCTAGRFFTNEPPGKLHFWIVLGISNFLGRLSSLWDQLPQNWRENKIFTRQYLTAWFPNLLSSLHLYIS